MNSVLKSYITSCINPSWEDGRSGAVLVCYVKYTSVSGEVITEQFKDKACYRSSYEKTRDMYCAIRDFLIKVDSSTKGVLSKYQGYKFIIKYVAFAYREAAKGNQYLETSYIDYDARLDPDDRLGSFITLTGNGASHE
jgi:hypothetical protein